MGARKKLQVLIFMSVLTCAIIVSATAIGHKGKQHKNGSEKVEVKSKTSQKQLQENEERVNAKVIARAYDEKIQPIFRRSCFDCHSDKTDYPWYYPIPGAKQLIDRDITEARKHLDISNGYPFKSHASATEDLRAIEDSVANSDMPPLRYRLLHWDAALSKKEKTAVANWVAASLTLLEKPKPTEKK